MITKSPIAWAALLGLSLLATAQDQPAAPKIERQLLSLHETVAEFAGTAKMPCRFRTSLCPDKCGHAGDVATFTILGYIHYEKPGEYGDAKTAKYLHKVDAALAKQLAALKPGDKLLLVWQHDYVTRTSEGGSIKSPERVIKKLEPLTAEKAKELLKFTKPVAPAKQDAPGDGKTPAKKR